MTAAQLSPGPTAARHVRPLTPPGPRSKRPRALPLIVGISTFVAIVIVAAIYLSRGPTLSGTYNALEGPGSMEFRGSKVYITTVLGTTFVSSYELDGDHVVIKGAGGAQVFTRRGPTLDGGMGMKFVKDLGRLATPDGAHEPR